MAEQGASITPKIYLTTLTEKTIFYLRNLKDQFFFYFQKKDLFDFEKFSDNNA